MAESIKFTSKEYADPQAIHAVWETRLRTAREELESAKAKGPGFEAQAEKAQENLASVEQGYQEYLNGGAHPESGTPAPETIH